ncbi:Hint domain-containing protein [Asaia lannensis]|uniref:Hint domain-containing protein n=1 Tax=Asaia lannensis NBRC 102526 TaxID=1307926 RepID=A0ABT1CMC6_9PROT|nr:Hint domain-containing protein [Asaia lannensis]MCO6161174.1 Hint domain-containing protein [Asaia lannensis NBRC 102526]
MSTRPSVTLNLQNLFNIAGNVVNNGTINVNNAALFNYNQTGRIKGTGTINLTNVTIASNYSNAQYYYANNTFTSISNQTINMTNSHVVFGSSSSSSGVTSAIKNVTINCNGGGNYIGICPAMLPSNVSGLKIRGFGNGDILDLCSSGSADSCSYDPATGYLTINTSYGGNTVTLTIDIGLGYNPAGFSTYNLFSGSSESGISYAGAPPCYLAGTLIDTARGPVAVEDITLSDRVMAFENGQEVRRRVIWVGKSQVEARCPSVIVRQNALGDNMPYRDLHVTEEHCMFFNGCFVPVRMLVNGHSIVLDKPSDSYDVYHIELDTHSVIRANGVLSESFLDTGHIAFEGRDSRDLTWEHDSAAPLCTAREFVEPLFRDIAARVPGLVVPKDEPAADATADIALLVNGKTQVAPTRRNGRTFVFSINEPIRSLSILTEAATPSDVIGPFVDDRRVLGALIGAVNLFTPQGMVAYKTHLSEPALTGWHGMESPRYRWTGAQAEIPNIRSDFEANIVSLEIYA